VDKAELLTNSAAKFIHDTFVMSVNEANEHAIGYVGLVIAQGGEPESFNLDRLQAIIVNALGEKYQWRDERKRQQALRDRQSSIDGYNASIEASKKSPFKKW